MTLDINKLLPLAVMAAIAWHSTGAVKNRIDDFALAQQTIVAQTEIQEILRIAQLNQTSESSAEFKNFRGYIRNHIKRVVATSDPSIDPWGRPYRHTFQRGILTVKSAGPDTRWGTDDDIECSKNLIGTP